MKVSVTQRDIDAGRKGDCFGCPIALAMERALGAPVSVTEERWRYVGNYVSYCPLPPAAINFIQDFDNHKVVQPFTFEV